MAILYDPWDALEAVALESALPIEVIVVLALFRPRSAASVNKSGFWGWTLKPVPICICLGILVGTGATFPFPTIVWFELKTWEAWSAVIDPFTLVILSLKAELLVEIPELSNRDLHIRTRSTATTIKTRMRMTMTATATAIKYSSRSWKDRKKETAVVF